MNKSLWGKFNYLKFVEVFMENNKLMINDSASFTKTISESDVYMYAGLTGDFNSLHINKVAAEESLFKGRIAHGMLVGGLISTVIGMHMPGPGTIYLGQNLKFVAPVQIGDTVTAMVSIVEIVNKPKGILKLKTVVTNQSNVVVIDGEAVVKIGLPDRLS
jgi:3-hydroxybutyryl-CoA dehydratase